MLVDTLKNFASQFEFKPKLEGGDSLENFSPEGFILCGMGGSHLAGGLLMSLNPSLDLTIHNDYDLPDWHKEDLEKRLIILSSYSGNTEEVLSAGQKAQELNLKVVAITTGGKLLEFAKENNIPYILLPSDGIEPRMAIGQSLRALLLLMKNTELLNESSKLKEILNPEDLEKKGEEIFKKIEGKIPVIYTSRNNRWLAYNWKIKLNETGKVPAFYNIFPEMNHNELESFDINESTKNLAENLFVVMLRDENDDSRIQKRMEIMENLLKEKGVNVLSIAVEGESRLHKIFNTLIIADWVSIKIAEENKVSPKEVSLIEDFKKRIA